MSTAVEEKKSTHKVEIVPVELTPHSGADLLSIVPVFGYTYVARTEDWVGVKRAAYIPPDSIVDASRPEFAFLAPTAKGLDLKVRIKAKKLRGVVSFGLMVPVPDDTPLGDDWAERLGVEHYEPPLAGESKSKGKGPILGGDVAPAPLVYAPKYDLDAFRRYHKLFTPGEPVVVTEKLDGANARFVCSGDQMHCGSRERWTREFPDYSHVTLEFLTAQGVSPEKAEGILAGLSLRAGHPPKRNIWWQALRDNPGLEGFCRDQPGTIIYGEVYGDVNCIKYGLGGNRFAAFDLLMKNGKWANPQTVRDVCLGYSIPQVPAISPDPIPYDFDLLCELAEGPTLVAGAKPGTIREGVVVSPIREREDPHLGRVKLKIVSGAYLEKYR